jgi:O-succinylhomoserine sulfhydrylase
VQKQLSTASSAPALQRPAMLGADIVTHSGTKYLDGQGRVVAGAVCASSDVVQGKLVPVMRSAGMSLSPFNAWVVLKGLETLGIRMQAQSQRALELAQWLESHPAVARVYYPGLKSHAQHALAMAQQSGLGGAVVSFDVIDSTQWLSVTANLGDVKTIITHPASTSHGRLSDDQRSAAGIGQGLIRVAVGLEHLGDLQADLSRGLDSIS